MGVRDGYTPGTFCWVDLVSADQAGSKAFYAGLFGWDYQDLPIGGGALYSVARLEGRPVAAIAPLPEPSVPPRWNSNVSVEDADAAAARAQELGATIVLPAGDVGGSGRQAVIQDPQGAVLSVWEPREHFGAGLVNVPGALSWNELFTPGVEASARFYRDLFGWRIDASPWAGGQYWSIANGAIGNGGLVPAPPGGPAAWTHYFAVRDAEATAARAAELGAQTVRGPVDAPGGRYVVLRDPQDAVFSVYAGHLDP